MNTFEKIARQLATQNPALTNYFTDSTGKFRSISQPIDKGALQLLQPFENAYLTYPPLEIEYLIQTLNEHIANCLDLRTKAQELESRIFFEVSEQLLTRALLDSVQNQSETIALNEPALLGNTINAGIEDGKIKGDKSSYWSDILKEQISQLKYRKEDIDNHLNKMDEDGSAMNYVARFEFIKELFNKDLIEAYCRAKTAFIGLKFVYNIDIKFPAIIDIGFLDKLTLWSREATYELEKKLFKQRFTNIVFSLHDYSNTGQNPQGVSRILTQDTYKTKRSATNIDFKLVKDNFVHNNQNLEKPLLRGIDLFFTTNSNPDDFLRLWRVKIKLPEQIIPIQRGIPDYAYKPIVFSPATTINYKSNMISTQIDLLREVHNVNPLGDWMISFEKNSIIGGSADAENTAQNIYIRMRIAYERE